LKNKINVPIKQENNYIYFEKDNVSVRLLKNDCFKVFLKIDNQTYYRKFNTIQSFEQFLKSAGFI